MLLVCKMEGERLMVNEPEPFQMLEINHLIIVEATEAGRLRAIRTLVQMRELSNLVKQEGRLEVRDGLEESDM